MPSLTVENYLKAILHLSQQSDSQWIATGKLAEALGVSPGTVTSMLKTLADADLAHYKPYEGVQLTSSGRKLALRMLRRHRLLELFLVRTLDLSWDQVHEEAEHMEHAVSDVLIDRIDEYLGRPQCDPHGDPIPTADGRMRGGNGTAIPLAQCAAGSRVRLVRVVNQGSGFLRYLSESGLELGVEGVVTANNPEAGVVTFAVPAGAVSLGHTAAAELLVQAIDGP